MDSGSAIRDPRWRRPTDLARLRHGRRFPMSVLGGSPISLRFVDFQVDQSDSVRPKGFHGKTVPKTATFSAHSGQLLVRFKSDALRNERGRRAVSLRPGLEHLIQRGGLLPVRMQIRIRTQSGLLVRRRPRTGQRRRPLSVHQRFIRREGIFIRPKENVRLSNKGGWCGAESGSANNWLG